MSIEARYVHTNLVAHDWQALAAFYEDLFGCTRVPPKRNYQGEELDAGTGIVGARVRGIHLRLPGYGEDGPTLEIYNYSALAAVGQKAINRPGYSHIAFEVADVEAAREAVLAAGGDAVGEVAMLTTTNGDKVIWCYVADPEGNAIELQSWV